MRIRLTTIVPLLLVLVVAVGVSNGDSRRSSSFRVGFAGSSSITGYPGAPSPARRARLLENAGAELARVTMQWNVVQPTPPGSGRRRYDWSRHDRTLARLTEAGIKPIIVLLGTPAWARERPPLCGDSFLCPPKDAHLDDFARFAVAVANRYPDMAAIEIWNEPNHASSWPVAGGPSPSGYARLFNSAGAALRRAHPGIGLIVGSVGYTLRPGPLGSDLTIPVFLDGFYDHVDRSVLTRRTRLGVHAYMGPRELESPRPTGQFNNTLAQVRAVKDARDQSRRIWVTELGASTTNLNGAGEPISEAEQASAISNSLDRLETARDVTAALVYTLVDREPDPSRRRQEGFGVLRRGTLDPKQAYCEIAERQGSAPARCAPPRAFNPRADRR